MSSSSGVEEALASPIEASAPVAAMHAKLMVATDSGDVQQLKDLVNKQEEDSKMMVLVMAKQQAAASAENPNPRQGNMDPRLLALASCGSSVELQTLLNGEHSHGSGNGNGSLPTRRATSSYGDDTEANESILAGKTAEGDTALHVVAACGEGDNFFTRFRDLRHLLAQQNNKKKKKKKRRRWCCGLSRAEDHAWNTYGDGDDFLESARIIYRKAKDLLFEQNNEGNTPLHCAARAGKPNMVKCLVDLALAEGGEGKMKELLWKENKHKETVLHEAVRVGNNKIVSLLMDKDSELANFPQYGGASPMYLAIILKWDLIEATLYEKSARGKLSFSGPNGQNALHAAVLRHHAADLTKLLKWNEAHLCQQNKDLTLQKDENGSTPLHFAATRTICEQLLDANPDALYQPDHAGFFAIHVAASVGASMNVDMFIKKYPGSAGLRDAKGRTFLHIAVEKKALQIIRNSCRNLSLSWIMNMVDNDGNTALHLAVQDGSLQMFCALLANPQVNLNLPNNRGETPLDIANYKIPKAGLFYNLNSESQISRTLIIVGAMQGVRREDHYEDNKTLKLKRDESKELEVLKDSTGTLCIGSVLITTVTFGTTFAAPGGYIADDHNNGGSPILARRFAFDAFITYNTFAFILSVMATIGLMYSGSPLVNPRSRQIHLGTAYYLVSVSLNCLATAFALGAYVVLAPVAQKTAVFTCVLTFVVTVYTNVELIWRRLLLLPPLCRRKGLIWALRYSALVIIFKMLVDYWPLLFIIDWTMFLHISPKIQVPAPAPAPAPLA